MMHKKQQPDAHCNCTWLIHATLHWSHLLIIVVAASLIQQALYSCIYHAKALNMALVFRRHLIDVHV